MWSKVSDEQQPEAVDKAPYLEPVPELEPAPTPVPGTSALGQRPPIVIQVVKSILTMAGELDFTVRGRNGVEWSGSGMTPNDGI